MDDLELVNKWMVEKVKFNTHREPTDIVKIEFESDI